MSTPTTALQTHKALTQQLIDQTATLWVNAGTQSDSAEGLGVDGRIALMHNLIDLSMLGWASLVQCVVKLPAAFPGMSQANEPLPSEVIDVPQAPFPRQLQAQGPFVRVGVPKVAIPEWCIGFKPAFLPPGVTQFQLMVMDYRYIGANYTGTIKLTAPASANVAPFEKVVTVGL